MSCPQIDEIIAYLDGELSVNRSNELRPHLEQCSVCAECHQQLARTVGRLAPPAAVDHALVQRIVARAQIETAPAVTAPVARRWLRWAVPAASLAAAALALVVLRPVLLPPRGPRSDDSAFSARGGAASNPRWQALFVYQSTRRGTYQEVREATRIASDARLVFGYLNQGDAHPYLMIFGVGERGQVFWYHPEYVKKDSDPTSIALARGRQELREEIQHDLPAGRLRLIALFSRQPLRVSAIERLLRQQRTPRDASVPTLGLKDTVEITRTVQVLRTTP